MINLPPPPSVESTPAAPALPAADLAPPGLRLVGGLIDYVILLAAGAVVWAIFSGPLAPWRILSIFVALAYLTYFWAAHGQTVGMMVFGFQVRDQKTGARPTWRQALGRACLWIAELGLSIAVVGLIAGLWMFWDPRRQALHDKLAGTIVTRT